MTIVDILAHAVLFLAILSVGATLAPELGVIWFVLAAVATSASANSTSRNRGKLKDKKAEQERKLLIKELKEELRQEGAAQEPKPKRTKRKPSQFVEYEEPE